MQLHRGTDAKQHVEQRHRRLAKLLALHVHNFHADPHTAQRVLDRVQRDPPAIGHVDTETAVADPLHQPEPGRNGPVHVVSARSRLHPQQPPARRLSGVAYGQMRELGAGGATTRRHRHHRRPSDYVGLQPLHRHPAAASLSRHRHARHRHGVYVFLVDSAPVAHIRLLQHDTMPSVSITAMSIIRVIHNNILQTFE